jgi:hypothetical protein
MSLPNTDMKANDIMYHRRRIRHAADAMSFPSDR